MANTVGLRVSIDGDATGAKRAIDDVNASFRKLNDSAKNLPTFMGSQVPGFNSNSRYVPPLTQQSSPYGVNSFYGQTSPGGVFPDGRRMPNSEQKIAQLTEQLAKLGETIKDVNQDLRDAVDNKDVGSEYQLSGTLNNLKASEAQIKNELKGLERERDASDSTKAIANYFKGNLMGQMTQAAVSAGSTIVGSQKALAGGNALESEIMKEQGIGRLIGGTMLGTIGAVGGGILAGPGGAMMGAAALRPLGEWLGGLFGDWSEVDANYSAQYKKALPAMDMFYQRYGDDIETKSGEENSKKGLDWYNRASDMSIGTGKTTEELMEAAAQRGAYGNFSAKDALYGARDDLMWERFTGANQNNISRMAGLSMRYGGDTKAVQSAYAGLTASGMGKGQFDEFLTSMQRIMEDGIEKGFVRGADEIAGNMTLLSRLSGGDALWTGEQGANRLMRMNEAVSNATGLKSVEDVLTFSVARDLIGGDKGKFYKLTGGNDEDGRYTGTYIDEMVLLERGVRPELLKDQFKAVRDMEGANIAGQIERFKSMYNLNYTGAKKVWEMSEKSVGWSDKEWEKQAEEIKALQVDPNYKSDSQLLQDVMTKIDTSLINIGKIKFDEMEIPKLQEVAGKIYDELRSLTGSAGGGVINLGSDDSHPADPAVAGMTSAEYGGYGARMGRVSASFHEMWEEGIFGERTQQNGRRTVINEDYQRLSNIYNNAMNRYTDRGSHGGNEITEREYNEFRRDILAALAEINRNRETNITFNWGE